MLNNLWFNLWLSGHLNFFGIILIALAGTQLYFFKCFAYELSKNSIPTPAESGLQYIRSVYDMSLKNLHDGKIYHRYHVHCSTHPPKKVSFESWKLWGTHTEICLYNPGNIFRHFEEPIYMNSGLNDKFSIFFMVVLSPEISRCNLFPSFVRCPWTLDPEKQQRIYGSLSNIFGISTYISTH